MSWLGRRLPDDPVARAYMEGTTRKPGRRAPVSGLHVVAVDVETSGMRVGRDRLLSLGGVDIADGEVRVGSAFSWYVHHPDLPVNEATRIHGILPADSAAGQPEDQVLRELLPRITDAVLVGHHVGFDASMLDDALKRRLGVRLSNPLVDTANLAGFAVEAFHRVGYPRQPPPSLEEVCTYLGLPMTERHTALGDAFTTATLFLLLCAKIRRRLDRPLLWGDLPSGRW